MAGQTDAAVREFQAVLNLRYNSPTEISAPLARLGLARAYASTHDAAKAKAAYQDFFSLWKNADPDVPVLKQAKLEYSKL